MSGRTRLAAGLLLAAPVAALAAGCTVESEPNGRDPDEVGVSPFTGERAESGPVLAVKVDNAPQARPHTGLDAADLIYVEPVEAGLSRLVAIYSSTLPERVGPVRSARETDLELLRQFGEPALAFSGAQRALLPEIDDARLFPRTPDDAPEAFTRDGQRPAPHNLFVDPAALLGTAPDASGAGDIGLRFGRAPEGGTPEDAHSVSYPSASFTFTWEADAGRWRVSMDGEKTDLAPATVVVQEVEVTASDLHDSNGNASPFTETVGQGEATVLRDGRAFEAEWDRDHRDEGTEFTTPDGDQLPFAEGQVWVVYTAPLSALG
ncbi:DUF3048 domain-containing protein [Streptomyces radicis]|uniref:DUF3048 domain-containing protein n=1 Tax=Streptomyces radicis TaxID=1750517 RepID=A0A3A9WR56_9ACTN|nr:DUF3048 domain-containing protein [Streptomyces radicis]RKN24587.1 DUF3048 domain-containing protein [Streptomyces radicis]